MRRRPQSVSALQYHDAEYIAKIKAVTSDTLHHAFDCISAPQTQVDSVKALGPGPGKVIILSAGFPIAHVLRTDVTIQRKSPSHIFMIPSL